MLTMRMLLIHKMPSPCQLTAIFAVSRAERRHSSRTGAIGPLNRSEMDVRIVVLCCAMRRMRGPIAARGEE